MRELLRGRYGRRSIVLLIAWTLGYSGMVYGFAGYESEILKVFGLTPGQTFGVILVSSVLGGGLALALCAVIGEAVERRMVILSAAVINAAALIPAVLVAWLGIDQRQAILEEISA